MNSPVLVFIPTYSERENVEKIFQKIRALPLECDVLFMDDHSPDGTGQILDKMAERQKGLFVIHRSGKLGIGSAHREGIAYAYDKRYALLVTMDCDFTHSPSDIPRLLEALRGYHVAIGSRYLQKGSLPGWNPFRRVLTLFAHFLTHVLLGNRYDASGAFRAYDLEKIPRRLFSSVKSKSYSFFFESLFILVNNGYQVNEIPIALPARTYGHSKLNFLEAWRSAKFLFRLAIEKRINPGRFRTGRKIDSENPRLKDPQNWNPYWDRKEGTTYLLYEITAVLYRRFIMRRNLKAVLRRFFSPRMFLLHAGCGSGQVDMGLHDTFNITAVDISIHALDLYARNNPQANRIEQADVMALPYAEGMFDGIYNLGLMEHFSLQGIEKVLREFHRVLKPGGRFIAFWPHRKAPSVFVLGCLHSLLNNVLKKNVSLHPPEISLLSSREEAEKHLTEAGFKLVGYYWGARDFFVQAVVVAEKA